MSLPIRYCPELYHRFSLHPESINRDNALWVLFSDEISLTLIQTIESQFGQKVVDAWKVANYEVVLMSGRLLPSVKELVYQASVDCADLTDIPMLSKPGLIVMDMDSTAIQIECIDEIAKLAGVGEQVSYITEQAMQGELDFEESLRARVATLKGANANILEHVKSNLPLMPELKELIMALQSYGWKTAIVSGGFTYFSDHLKQYLSLDHAYANQLEIESNQLTGKVLGEVVSAQTKADLLISLTKQYGVPIQQTVAIGDGANDLLMMDAAGLGIAFHAKPKVDEKAQVAIRYAQLAGVLCLLSVNFNPTP